MGGGIIIEGMFTGYKEVFITLGLFLNHMLGVCMVQLCSACMGVTVWVVKLLAENSTLVEDVPGDTWTVYSCDITDVDVPQLLAVLYKGYGYGSESTLT